MGIPQEAEQGDPLLPPGSKSLFLWKHISDINDIWLKRKSFQYIFPAYFNIAYQTKTKLHSYKWNYHIVQLKPIAITTLSDIHNSILRFPFIGDLRIMQMKIAI